MTPPQARRGWRCAPARPRRTIRLRLTALYGGLFLLCGAVLLAITYGLVVQAFVGNSAGNALCRASRAALGVPRHRPAAGARHRAAGARRRAARAASAGPRSRWPSWRCSRSRSAGSSPAGCCGRCAPSPRPPATSPPTSLGERLALGGPRDELKELADTFDGCSPGWRRPSPPSGSSSPTPRTSCAPRWPGSGSSARSRWPTPTPPSNRCAPPTSGSSPPAPSSNSSSTRCSPWPAARPASTSENPSTWPRWPARSWPPANPRPRPGSWLCTPPSTRPQRRAPAPGRAPGRQPRRQRAAPQLPGGHVEVAPGSRNSRAVLSVPTPGPPFPRGRARPAPAALPAARRRPHRPRRRPRPRPVHRPGHRRGPRRHADRRPRPGGGLLVEVSFPMASAESSSAIHDRLQWPARSARVMAQGGNDTGFSAQAQDGDGQATVD